MPDSEKTFKIKIRSPWAVFEISLTSAVIEFCMEKRLYNIFKTTSITKLTLLVSHKVVFIGNEVVNMRSYAAAI